MGRRIKCKALVLRSSQYGESSKMLTAVTDELGKISISAKGASKPQGPFLASAQDFCYSVMELSEGKNGIYTLCECELINSFYDLRENLDVLFAAYEIGKTVLTVSQEQNPDNDLLRLTLNTLYCLSTTAAKTRAAENDAEQIETIIKKRIEFIRSVFYIRLASDQGFFNYPEDFREKATEQAVSHITSNDFKEIFAFGLSNSSLSELSEIAEKARTGVLE